jgi:hypothetical protein
MKRLLIAAAILLAAGFGCAKPPADGYPGTEPYVSPTTPPPGA